LTLITGRYRRDLPQTLPLRCGDNQVLHTLTDLGRARSIGGDSKRGRHPPPGRVALEIVEEGAPEEEERAGESRRDVRRRAGEPIIRAETAPLAPTRSFP
jgi:hypothetical protein